MDTIALTFPLFASLPSELRLKIWSYLLPDPRVVAIRYNRTYHQYTSTTAQPELLHICSETRSLFLETHTKLRLSPKYESSVYVNFDIDTVFFDHLDCSPDGDLSIDLAASPHSNRIIRCAIDAQLWEVLRVFRFDSLSEVRLIPNLRTIALVIPRERERGHEQRTTTQSDGVEVEFVQVDSRTINSEITHVQYYVDCLRWELESGTRAKGAWPNGIPNVQMWLW